MLDTAALRCKMGFDATAKRRTTSYGDGLAFLGSQRRILAIPITACPFDSLTHWSTPLADALSGFYLTQRDAQTYGFCRCYDR